jgi:hypothetical protein
MASMLNPSGQYGTPVAFIQAMENELSARTSTLPDKISELAQWGLDSAIAASLIECVKEGHAEVQVVMAFLYALTQSANSELFGRAFKRVILKGWKQVVPGEALDRDMKAALVGVTSEEWNWMPINHDMAVLP